MALQSSGQISLANIAGEFGGTAPHSLSEYYGKGGAVSSGQISIGGFYGRSNAVTMSLTISSNTTDYNLKTAATNAGWNGTTPINLTCTINSGVTVYATSTGVYAFQTGTSYPAGSTISIINNGTILGKGGNGGQGGTINVTNNGYAGSAGGPAFYAGAACTVTNNGRISGGGGGGGGGAL